MSKKQREWFCEYERRTGFDPLYQQEFKDGGMSFSDAANLSLTWLKDWVNEVSQHLEAMLPKED